jgi:hypothetical protein
MAGKGDRPRKVNGPKYRSNYDSIVWKPTIRDVPFEEFKKDILKFWTPDKELLDKKNTES